MTPGELDAVDDETFAAMVRLMVAEADAIRANNAKLPAR
jgi:hypothetical protein